MKKIKEQNNSLLIKIGFLILLVCIAIGSYWAYKNIPGVKENVNLATTVKPETFTELYFENHLKLPSTVKVGEKYTFSFTVHNLEYKTRSYPYEVYLDTNGQNQYIEKSSFILKQNSYKTIIENFSVNLATKSAVVVSLINKNQSIDFWVRGVK